MGEALITRRGGGGAKREQLVFSSTAKTANIAVTLPNILRDYASLRVVYSRTGKITSGTTTATNGSVSIYFASTGSKTPNLTIGRQSVSKSSETTSATDTYVGFLSHQTNFVPISVYGEYTVNTTGNVSYVNPDTNTFSVGFAAGSDTTSPPITISSSVLEIYGTLR